MDFNFGPKVPFPGVLDIDLCHSPQVKPCKSADYFIKVSSLCHIVADIAIVVIVVDMMRGESIIFQISNWKLFLLLKIYLL